MFMKAKKITLQRRKRKCLLYWISAMEDTSHCWNVPKNNSNVKTQDFVFPNLGNVTDTMTVLIFLMNWDVSLIPKKHFVEEI